MEDTRKVKPWEELSEEERQKIRESWKVKLPEKFDVFCDGDWECDYDIVIPGDLYVKGNIDADAITVHGYACIGGSIYCTSILVGENLTVDDKVFVDDGAINVGNDFTVYGNTLDCYRIYVYGNVDIPYGNVTCLDIFIHGSFHLNGQIDNNGCKIRIGMPITSKCK